MSGRLPFVEEKDEADPDPDIEAIRQSISGNFPTHMSKLSLYDFIRALFNPTVPVYHTSYAKIIASYLPFGYRGETDYATIKRILRSSYPEAFQKMPCLTRIVPLRSRNQPFAQAIINPPPVPEQRPFQFRHLRASMFRDRDDDEEEEEDAPVRKRKRQRNLPRDHVQELMERAESGDLSQFVLYNLALKFKIKRGDGKYVDGTETPEELAIMIGDSIPLAYRGGYTYDELVSALKRSTHAPALKPYRKQKARPQHIEILSDDGSTDSPVPKRRRKPRAKPPPRGPDNPIIIDDDDDLTAPAVPGVPPVPSNPMIQLAHPGAPPPPPPPPPPPHVPYGYYHRSHPPPPPPPADYYRRLPQPPAPPRLPHVPYGYYQPSHPAPPFRPVPHAAVNDFVGDGSIDMPTFSDDDEPAPPPAHTRLARKQTPPSRPPTPLGLFNPDSLSSGPDSVS
jgi:hypothetical protein